VHKSHAVVLRIHQLFATAQAMEFSLFNQSFLNMDLQKKKNLIQRLEATPLTACEEFLFTA